MYNLSNLSSSFYSYFRVTSMWKFVFLLVLAQGAFSIDPSTYWVLEILECSKLRVIMKPNKNLVETEEALDQVCMEQEEFYYCLENILRYQDIASVTELTSVLEYDRSLFAELCSKDSIWRRRYLEFAPCINMQQTEFCYSMDFIFAEGGIPCNIRDRSTNCIASTLTIKCSIEAAHLFQYLKKLTSNDYLTEKLSYHYSKPKPVLINSTASEIDKLLNSLSNQFLSRIGRIPEQDEIDSLILHDQVDDLQEKSANFVDETELLYIEDNLVPDWHITNSEYHSDIVENIVSNDYEYVSKLIASALDALDENLVTDSPIQSTETLFREEL